MATGYDIQITRQIGEHLVSAELGKRGIIATPFAGNVPHFDLLAANKSGKSIPIQVKAIKGPSWQFNAAAFLKIEFQDNYSQKVNGKSKFKNPNLICVFVHLKKERDEFYIFKWRILQNFFLKHYKNGLRPNNPKSTHCAIWPKHLTKYKDNWALITDQLEE